MSLPIPDNFEQWSEECKNKYRDLKKQYDDRETLEKDIRKKTRARDEKQREFEDVKGELEDMEARLDELNELIKTFWDRLKEYKQELKDELQEEYDDWLAAGDRTNAEIAQKQQELKRRYNEGVKEFKEQRKQDIAERKQLRRDIKTKQKEVEDKQKEVDKMNEELDQKQEELDEMPSFDKIGEDYYALIRKCGSQDPKPGEPSIPITPKGYDDQKFHYRYGWLLRELKEDQVSDIPKQTIGMPGMGNVQASRYEGLTDVTPLEKVPMKQGEEVADKRVWHEGCILILWVEGTNPKYSKEHNSNPITKTVQDIAGKINSLWAPCCVRFNFYLKVVSLAQLGKLSDKDTGVHVNDKGKTQVADKDDIQNDYGKTINDLRDEKSKKCTVLLIVDQVGKAKGDEAGHALVGGGVGVTEPDGDIAAHEIGHAVGGIEHEGGGNTHGHGELMWGEGSLDYPDRKKNDLGGDIPYEKVNPKDCESMCKNTTPTEEPCEEGEVH